MTVSAVEETSDSLRALIARGQYRPGDRLPPERVLAKGFGVSRPTMREAIRRLTDAGLLEAHQGSGTYVAEVNFEEVFAVRLYLEPYAARLAAKSRTSAELDRLRALVKRLEGHLDSPEDFAAIDFEIHALVANAARNSVLLDVLSRLVEVAKLSRAVTSPDPTVRAGTVRRMRRLVRAIGYQDEAGAADAMALHLSDVRAVALKDARAHLERRRLSAVAGRAPTDSARSGHGVAMRLISVSGVVYHAAKADIRIYGQRGCSIKDLSALPLPGR